jgi:pyrrolidone-carboxylate peptidase
MFFVMQTRDAKSSEMIELNVTGFGAFHGVTENPSKAIVTQLQQESFSHPNTVITYQILDVSIPAVDTYFHTQQTSSSSTQSTEVKKRLYLHFGVAGSNTRYEIEQRAYNEKSFRAPDNAQLQPMKQCINGDCTLDSYLSTNLNLPELVNRVNSTLITSHEPILNFVNEFYNRKEVQSTKDPLMQNMNEEQKQLVLQQLAQTQQLEIQNDKHTIISEDAGRFLCNYIYYKSLDYCKEKAEEQIHSLFVHVPSHETIPVDQQIIFARTLITELLNLLHSC